MYFQRQYIYVHTFHSSCRCSHFFIVLSMLDLFSCFLLVCLKNFEKTQKYFLLLFGFSFQFNQLQYLENPKRFLDSSFACWELSRVNSFSRFVFLSLNCFLARKTKNSKNISVCFSEFLFFLLSHNEEKTTMKMLSGSHMHHC